MIDTSSHFINYRAHPPFARLDRRRGRTHSSGQAKRNGMPILTRLSPIFPRVYFFRSHDRMKVHRVFHFVSNEISIKIRAKHATRFVIVQFRFPSNFTRRSFPYLENIPTCFQRSLTINKFGNFLFFGNLHGKSRKLVQVVLQALQCTIALNTFSRIKFKFIKKKRNINTRQFFELMRNRVKRSL